MSPARTSEDSDTTTGVPFAASAALSPPPAFSATDVIAGASGTSVMLIVPDWLAESAPPEPLLPPSFSVTVSARVVAVPPAVGSSDVDE